MAIKENNLSENVFKNDTNFTRTRVGIIVSQWNKTVTDALYEGAYKTLIKAGCSKKNITTISVPGTYELPAAANWMAARAGFNCLICLGAVIKGETPHFDYICQAVANGLIQVSVKHDRAVIFGVLTTDNLAQALERAGGKHGNKGEEAALTALSMSTIHEIIYSW